MPLDGHSYLVAQGWGGRGTGLRQGAIVRPLAIPQKKNLAGLGKDRDEAFPFWDHLFTAAAKSIQVKCLSDDDSEDTCGYSFKDVSIKRTSTGILSTRRPVNGTPADSGATTPNDVESSDHSPRISLIVQAKRDAAKRGLYSRFFRGPIIGPEVILEEEKRLDFMLAEAISKQDSNIQSITVSGDFEVQMSGEVDFEESKSSARRKRKPSDTDEAANTKFEDEILGKERKRRKKEEKRKKQEEKDVKAKHKREKKKNKEPAAFLAVSIPPSNQGSSSSKYPKNYNQDEVNLPNDDEKSERRSKKEKKARKALENPHDETAKNGVALKGQEQDALCYQDHKGKSTPRKSPNQSKTENGETIGGEKLDQPEKKKKR